MMIRYCKCENCGAEVEFDASIALDTFPQKYGYICQECHHCGFVNCEDAYGKAKIEFSKPTICCNICGEYIADGYTNSFIICDECKEVIKWAKRKMKDEQIRQN